VRRFSLRHLVPVAIVALLIAVFYQTMNGTGMISQQIGEAVHAPGAQELDLAKLTSFGWDRFYYFKPGTSRDEICDFIGAKVNRCQLLVRYEVVPDDSNALVFSLNGRLTHMELHAVANGEFDFAAGREGFAREGAVFRIRRSLSGVDQERIFLEPK
jgi:hypothetical protein